MTLDSVRTKFRARLEVASVLFLFATGTAASAFESLSYHGLVGDAQFGRVEDSAGEIHDVAVGEEIPGWGVVVEMSEEDLTVEPRVEGSNEGRVQITVRRRDLYRIPGLP